MKQTLTFSGRTTLLLALTFLSIIPGTIWGQSDNFDAAALDSAWQKSEFSPALTSYTFPTAGAGRALRLQANPAPPSAPAVAAIYRTNVYTDFYAAMDVLSWADKNEAMIVFGRFNNLSANNPGTGSGMICNYDANQYGDTATSRRQGQLQINKVAPGFAATTLALSEVTFVPGRSYRIILKGIGTHYWAYAYDLSDLTAPLVTLEADDPTYTSGVCGILGYSRDGVVGTMDVTLDNYVAAAADPSLAAAPATQHPIPGTPMVESRVPVQRFQNFHDRASGLSFVAKTYGTNLIDSAATKLRLNGADVSSQLVLPTNGTTANISFPGSGLKSNAVYTAQLELTDTTGTRKSTNLFWFDTFSDAYLRSGAVKVIEAEEYNYQNGQFQADPIPVSGFTTNNVQVNGSGVGYLDLVGVEGVDFHDNRMSGEAPWTGEFRIFDPVGLSQGMFPELTDVNFPGSSATTARRFSDNIRSQYAASNLLEFVVHRTEPGEWLNYTRVFNPGKYFAYLRVASFGATAVDLQRVTSDPTAPNQTTNALGTFSIPNNMQRYNYRYIQAMDTGGSPAVLNLTGTNTLRLAIAGVPSQDIRKIAINYLLLVPAPDVQLFSSTNVAGPYTVDGTAVVDSATRTITLSKSGDIRFYRLSATDSLTVTNISVSGNTVTLKY